jgi:hypothetical protein
MISGMQMLVPEVPVAVDGVQDTILICACQDAQ